MLEGLQRSAEAQAKIHDVRKEALGSREKAQEGRMDIMLNNGALAERIFSTLQTEPDLPKNELVDRVKQTGDITHPEVLDNMLDQIYSKKEQIARICTKLDKDSMSDDEFAELFYRSIINTPNESPDTSFELSGSVKVDTSNPLAIVVEVETAEDFKRLGVPGAAENRALTSVYRGQRVIGGVPVILTCVEYASDMDKTFKHEYEHAKMNIFHQALLNTASKINDEKPSDDETNWVSRHASVWGDGTELDTPRIEAARALKKAYEDNPEEIQELRESKLYQQVMISNLADAKDEVIAYMSEGQSSSNFLLYLTDRGGPYDALKNLQLPDKVYDMLWEDYTKQLSENTAEALEIYEFYRSDHFFDQRNQTFKWVLAQIPMTEWKEQLSKMPFDREIDDLKGLFQGLTKKYRDLYSEDPNKAAEFQQKFIPYLTAVRNASFEGTMFEEIQQAKFLIEDEKEE